MDYRVFDTLLDGVIVVDECYKLVYCNEAAANFIHLPLRRLKSGMDFASFFMFDKSIFPESMKSITEPTPYFERQLNIDDKTSELLQITIQPQSLESDNVHWIVYLRNMTLEAQLHRKYHIVTKQKQEAMQQALQDSLTKIYNKRAFTERYAEVLQRVKETREDFCLAVFDLDNFKKVNDTYGHAAGDYVLAELALVVQRMLRDNDFFARYGGEEFVIILAKCRIEDGLRACERIREKIALHQFIYEGQKLEVTVSLGVGQFAEHYADGKEFFETVDKASYESKRNGKNRVTAVPLSTNAKKAA